MKRSSIVLIVLILLTLGLAACGGGGDEPTAVPSPVDTATPVVVKETVVVEVTKEVQSTVVVEKEVPVEIIKLPEVNPLEVTGDVIAAGSSTVFPLAERMAERFVAEGYSGNITIDSIGSGAGFERFCTAGESDISDASRPIKDSEVENCAAIGRTPIEFRIGTDALAVVVNPANEFLAGGVTLEELAKIFSNEATTWADVNPAWPAEEIKRFSPGTDSGTFDYFIEAVMDPVYGDAAEDS
ncbi:MAG: substrate-binding domain-containing protein, partial [Caldilineales bacterium]|nr:substrate-binding domain-containing protein [Caldilineales bacterium]